MNRKLKIFFLILAIAFGSFLFVYGGFDDSPGAQGLGVLLAILGIGGLTRKRKVKDR